MNDGAYLGDEVLDGSMKIFHNRVFAVLVDNEPGTLARIVGLFSGRGYNIDSLTVTEVDPAERVSRLTLVTSGTLPVLQQIRAQLERLVPVRKVQDLSAETRFLSRELALVKVAGRGRKRLEALRLADAYKAEIVEADIDYFIFQLTLGSDRISRFIDVMRPLGLVEVCRTGVAALGRDRKSLQDAEEASERADF